ncbi:MAG: transporter related protein [Nocardioides sp.]|jgi:putative ABC transport system ATP-binding protein|nr:transporter related protein [Nocardioides sp.]
MTDTRLRADRVYRFYRVGDEETLAVQGVTLELVAGEVVALCGPSGSGKSTLLACLAGIDEPSGGTVWIAGERISGRTEAERARVRARRVGAMSQSGNLFGHLTVLGNLRLAQSLAQGRGVARERRPVMAPAVTDVLRGLHDPDMPDAMELLAELGISTRAHAWPDQLSGGELVRASLAVALANGPVVLLADEPTGELDETSEARLLSLLRQRAENGAAVLVASHSQAVTRAADRTLYLEDGQLT